MAEGNKTLKIVGITCGVILLVGLCGVGGCFLFCGGTFAGVWQATEAPARATKGFFSDVRGGQYAQAHQRLSPSFQQRLPLDRFQTEVQSVDALMQQTDDTITSRQVSGMGATMGGFLTTPGGSVPVEATLSKQGEHWYIESLTVGGRVL